MASASLVMAGQHLSPATLQASSLLRPYSRGRAPSIVSLRAPCSTSAPPPSTRCITALLTPFTVSARGQALTLGLKGRTAAARQDARQGPRVRAQATANAKSPSSAPEPRADGGTNLLYTLLFVWYTGNTLSKIISPHSVAVQFGAPIATAMQENFLRGAAFGVVPLVGALYSLKQAATNNRLQSPTYQRLNLAVTVYSLNMLFFVVSAYVNNLPIPLPALGTSLAAAIVSAAVSYSIYATGSPTGASPISVVEGFLAGLKDVTLPKNAVSAAYSVLTVTLFLQASAIISGFALVAPPALFLGPAGQILLFFKKVLVGGGFLVAAIAAYSLKDAAERDRLGASTFRQLNASLALTGGGMIAEAAVAHLTGTRPTLPGGAAPWYMYTRAALLAYMFVLGGYNAVAPKK